MITVKDCNFSNSEHTQAIITLMNNYMADDMGGKLPPYNAAKEKEVVHGLETHPAAIVLLVEENGKYIGLANCFMNFGTFAAKPFINIHDIVVLSSERGKGVGKVLMEAITEKAKNSGCSKITLEVREDNRYAQKLYAKMGYAECEPRMHFWTKYL